MPSLESSPRRGSTAILRGCWVAGLLLGALPSSATVLADADPPAALVPPTATQDWEGRDGRQRKPSEAAAEPSETTSGETSRNTPKNQPATFRATITVTASREEKDSFEEPATVEVVSREDLMTRKKVAGFVDAFGEMPAVSVQRTAWGQGSPFIRGFTGFHDLLLIDGIRFNNSILRSGPNQYWATVDPLVGSRIELVKGPGSVLYGSDAVGGTVNLITRSPELSATGPAARSTVYYRGATAENSSSTRVEVEGGRRGVFSYLAGGSFSGFGDLEAGEDTGTVEDSAYGEYGADAKLRLRAHKDGEVTLAFQLFRQNDVPRTETTVFSKPFHATQPGTELRRDHDQRRSLAYLRYRRQRPGAAVAEAEYTFAYQTTEEGRLRVQGNRRSDVSGFDVATWSGQVQLRSLHRGGRLTYGAEISRDAVDSFRTDFNPDGTVRRVHVQGAIADDSSYDLLGIYVQDELSLADRHLTLTLGGRFSHQRLEADRVEDPETGEAFSLSSTWSRAVGSVRVLWRPRPLGADRWHLFANVAQAFRAPNLSDLTSFDATSAVETPTPGLGPEDYLNFELGAKTRTARSSWTGSVFYTVIDDQIVQSPTGRLIGGTPEVQKSNVGDGFIQGVEMEGRFRVRPAVELWANLSWMEGRVDQFLFDASGAAQKVRAPVSRVIPWMSNWGLRFDPPRGHGWIELHGTAFSKADKLALRDLTDTRRIPPGGTPGFAVVGVRGALETAGGRLAVAAGVENVFDEDYRIHGSGQNMPGRNLVASVAWRR